MGTLTNSEDPNEMLHNAAFHQSLHCLLKEKRSSDKKIHFFLLHPDIPRSCGQWTTPNLLHQIRRKNPLVYKGLSHQSHSNSQLCSNENRQMNNKI